MRDDTRPTDRTRLTIGDAAGTAGVSRQTVYGWIARGRPQPHLTDDDYGIDAVVLARRHEARRAAVAVGVGLGTVLHRADVAAAEA